MPCLNEERTVGICIAKAKEALSRLQVSWEIIVADNGSVDRSVELALSMGARVVHQALKGYGNAYLKGIGESTGKFIVIGDSDDSYDFSDIERFIAPLKQGHDMVIGNRLKGKIMPGAMPWLHRYIGNPLLSKVLNVLYDAKVHDCHCGMRAFTREAFNRMNLKSSGMEFASEMVIKAARERLKIAEIPTTLYKDGRNRKPHLRSFRDGWRHLRLMLAYSPTYLFVLPGSIFIGLSAILFGMAAFQVRFFGHVFGAHMSVAASMLAVLGSQILSIACFSKVYFLSIGMDIRDKWAIRLVRYFKLEFALGFGLVMVAIAISIDAHIIWKWVSSHFGALAEIQAALFAATLFIVSVQWLFSAFFVYILTENSKNHESLFS